ncbi:hypothetical protein EMPS_01407 [Entomortierella parvispora]|uniref:Uncharacterized protein n=1 Tax=Entomortierella parvispora TaxID=205924 RepID=A0A9P3H2S3_9FUNG|nr:hypothetical protein EMPS_01407 [Entomortierella parvispora]
MGRTVGRDLDREMMAKIHTLFDRILDTVNKENPNFTFDFEQFVDCFDEDDQFIKRVFQFLVKETAQRHRTAHPQTQQPLRRPYTIHHSPAHTRVIRSLGPAPASYLPADSPRMRRPYSATVYRHINDPAEMEQEQEEEEEAAALQHDLSEDEEVDLDMQLDAAAAAASTALASMSSVSDLVPGGSLTSYYSSGAALRSMLDARGTGPYSRSRRSRMAHRMLSYDLLTLDQNRSHLESLLNPHPFGSAPSTTTGSGSASGTRRTSGLVLRRATTRSILDSMESAPESFAQPASAPLPSSGSTFYGIQSQEPLHLPGHEWRQQMIRSVYAQHLQERERARARTLQTLNGQTAGSATANGATPATTTAQDTPGHQQQQQQPGQSTPAASATPQSLQADQQSDRNVFTPHENALLLVEPSTAGTNPGDSSTSASVSSPSSTAQASAAAARPSLSSYEEFQNLTRRGREVLRNEYANELYIEEDSQVLMTGDVSRRRRRRGGQTLNPNDGQGDTTAHAYDIAADNSSTIISQSQQQTTVPSRASPRESTEVATSTTAANAAATGAATTDRETPSSGGVHQETQPEEAAGLSVPTITVQGTDGAESGVESSSNSHDRNNGSNPNSNPRRRVGFPPTPPSPNPNRNPMPTFTDRRRSSINPADIEAIAREMEQQR